MIIQTQHFQKWIPADKAVADGLKYWAFGQGLLLANRDSSCEGLCVFQSDHLNIEFLERLDRRFQAEDFNLKVYLPRVTVARFQRQCPPALLRKIEFFETEFYCLESVRGRPEVRTKIRVLNVDDSPVILKMLGRVLTSSSGIEVIGQISDSKEAVAKILRLNPDVVTMDIQMPGLTGVQVTEELAKTNTVPVLIVSSLGLEEGSMVYDALQKGAFDYVQKPQLTELDAFRIELVGKIELALTGHSTHLRLRQTRQPQRPAAKSAPVFGDSIIWCFGASTGGTQALTRVMTGLPAQIPPTLVVQHIPPVFSKSFARSLDSLCPFSVKEATDGDILRPNTVYIAPGGFQMKLMNVGRDLVLSINDDPAVNRFKPSVDYLFMEIAKIRGRKILAGIFTGMGKDGAAGLLALRQAGASTFAQDKDSSVVYGMPRAAFEIGAAETILDIDAIAEHLIAESRKSKKSA